MVAACVFVILLFHLAWAKHLFINYHNSSLFLIGDIVLLLFFSYAAYISYSTADDPNYEFWRKVAVWAAIASSVWAAGWSVATANPAV